MNRLRVPPLGKELVSEIYTEITVLYSTEHHSTVQESMAWLGTHCTVCIEEYSM